MRWPRTCNTRRLQGPPLAMEEASQLVFRTSIGTELDAVNVRCAFRRVVDLTRGLSAAEWTPRELRHSFASLLRAKGVSISQLVGRKSTQATRRCTGTSCDRC